MTEYPKRAVIVTEKASLHITIEPFTNRNTQIIEHYSISIGSRKSKCLHLTVPGIGRKEGTLNWVSKMIPECYLDAKDTARLSQHIIQLAFTIGRDINPVCNRYLLDDCSSFPCSLPNGKKHVVPMKPFYIAFHGSTWYEYYFGAKLVYNHEQYERCKLNLYNSSKKPATFSFKHADLDELLQPLYASTATWWEFFQAIQLQFGDKKCAAVYPWLTDAMFEIFDHSNIYDVHKWYIDLAGVPLIPFRAYTDMQSGGKRATKKHRPSPSPSPIFTYNYFELQSMNYKKFLE